MKLVTTTIVALFVSTAAYAQCSQPTLNLNVSEDSGYSNSEFGYGDPEGPDTNVFGAQTTFSIGLSIPLGNNSACKRAEVLENDRLLREIYTEEAEKRRVEAQARKERANARDQELDNLEQRIAICSDFELSTAPSSIKSFCGDLLQ